MNLFNINRIFGHIDVQITNIELIRGKKRALYGMEATCHKLRFPLLDICSLILGYLFFFSNSLKT